MGGDSGQNKILLEMFTLLAVQSNLSTAIRREFAPITGKRNYTL